MGKVSNQKMPPTHTWIWEITHTCSQKRSATKYLPHLSNVIDEHTKCVAALSVDCCQYANQIYKDAQKSTESTIRKKTTTERLNEPSHLCTMHSFCVHLVYAVVMFGWVHFSSFRCFIWLLNELCRFHAVWPFIFSTYRSHECNSDMEHLILCSLIFFSVCVFF